MSRNVAGLRGLIAIVIWYNVFILLYFGVCDLWNECVFCNMGHYTDSTFHVDGGALCLGLIFYNGRVGWDVGRVFL